MSFSNEDRVRFWDKVQAVGECWEWQGCLHKGYGFFWNGTKPVRTHRHCFLMCHGWLPDVVRHSCDNPACVRPSHLLAGSQLDNIQDREDRQRSTQRGASHTRAYLTDAIVLDIRRRYDAGEKASVIARDLEAPLRTILNLATRKRRRNIAQ